MTSHPDIEESSIDNSSTTSSIESSSSNSSYSSIHIHNYIEEVINPNCIASGYTIYTCDCGETYTDKYVDALGHDYQVKETINATYEEYGKIIYECTRCHDSYFEEIDKLEHHYSSELSFNESSHFHACVDAGYENLKIDEAVHEFNTVETEFSTTYTCNVCGYTYTDYLTMPKTADRYELVCKGVSLVDGDEIAFNDNRDNIFSISKVENG